VPGHFGRVQVVVIGLSSLTHARCARPAGRRRGDQTLSVLRDSASKSARSGWPRCRSTRAHGVSPTTSSTWASRSMKAVGRWPGHRHWRPSRAHGSALLWWHRHDGREPLRCNGSFDYALCW